MHLDARAAIPAVRADSVPQKEQMANAACSMDTAMRAACVLCGGALYECEAADGVAEEADWVNGAGACASACSMSTAMRAA